MVSEHQSLTLWMHANTHTVVLITVCPALCVCSLLPVLLMLPVIIEGNISHCQANLTEPYR